jgi:hypothetical protein
MPQIIATVAELQTYLSGVSDRAADHAPNVTEVILALAGAVVMFKDPDSELEARTYRGRLANLLFVYMNGVRYVFRHNHEEQSVEIRRGSNRGRVVGSFTNATSLREILRVFETL